MDLLILAALFVTGIVAGVFNSIAGGATFISFPVLLAVGLPPMVANATNFVAMLPSNAAAVPGFRKELASLGKRLWIDLAICAVGGLLGVLLLLWLGEGTFTALIPWLMLIAVGVYAAGARIRIVIERVFSEQGGDTLGRILLFLFSIYGGYFGAGVGVILLAALTIAGYHNPQLANAVKNAAGTVITVAAVFVVAGTGLVSWPPAIAMMLGAAVGGAFGGSFSRKVSPATLRIIVIGFGLLVSVVYLWRAYGP